MAEKVTNQQAIKAQMTAILRRIKPILEKLKVTWAWLKQDWRRLVTGLIAIVVAVVALTFLGIYGLGWQNWYTRLVSAAVPFPAAYTGDHAISYSNYYGHYRLLSSEAKKGGSNVTGKELAQESIGQLVQQSILQNYANQQKIRVTSASVEEQLQKIYGAEGGKDKVAALLKQQYGVSLKEYAQMVRQRLLEQAVQTRLADDLAAKSAAMKQALSVLKQAQGGADFDKLASRYSQDITASSTGLSGLVPVESTPLAVQDAVAKIGDGQIVANPILAGGKVYVVKRAQSVENHPLVRVIVIPVANLNTWLAKQIGQTKQAKLLPQLR